MEVGEMGKQARRVINGNGDGGGHPALAYQNAAEFLAAYKAAPSNEDVKDNLEQEAISWSPAQDVQFAAMSKINLQMQALVVQLNTRVNQAQGQVAAANTLAWQGSGSGTQCCKRGSIQACSTPEVWGQEEGRACGSLDPCHQRLSSNCSRRGLHPMGILYSEGGPRALWTNVYEAYKRANGGNEPSNPCQFFHHTLEADYGLRDLDQKYRDTWNSLRMGPSQSVTK
jgi:hypothetical protein